MHKMYSSMGKGELGLHKSAAEKCWMQKCGEMQVAKSEGAKEQPLRKSEDAEVLKKAEEAVKAAELAKSELEAKTKENGELKKNIEELTLALNNFLSKKGPTRKAITSIEYIKKSDESTAETKELTKSEVNAILFKKASDASLSKTDREAINKYYRGAGLKVVKHLLTQ